MEKSHSLKSPLIAEESLKIVKFMVVGEHFLKF
jgi:hypothetical protein